MSSVKRLKMKGIIIFALIAFCLSITSATQAQQPAYYPSDRLDNMVSRIALYPDPLLAQTLAAATYPDQIPEAARWADEHHYLSGPDLANAINYDRLYFDPSVQSLLPFPSVLDMMAADMNWTSDLGNAFLSQRQEVMDAVQRMRQRARDYGYLQSNSQVVVTSGPYIEIRPYNPSVIYVPYYDPLIVYAPPRRGFFVGSGIGWGIHISIGSYYRPWGWGASRFEWNTHSVIINNNHWDRDWQNRREYVHPYEHVERFEPSRRMEQHEAITRTERERQAARYGYHPQ